MDDSPNTHDPANLDSTPSAVVPENSAPGLAHPLRSLTRLVIGSVEIGIDELFRLLQLWEEEVEKSSEVKSDPGAGESGSAPQESSKTALRLALIGLIFETQERVEREAWMVGKVGGILYRWTSPWTGPIKDIYDSRFTSLARTRFQRLVARGEAATARWVAIGRAEDARSRRLAQIAFDETVDEYIEYLTSNPEVQELVQKQSTGLANEVIEEVRERTVSADNLLEGIARSILHRVPRSALPEPSAVLRKIAASRPAKSQGENQ